MFKHTTASNPTECTKLLIPNHLGKLVSEALMVKPMREAVMKGGRQNESARRAELGTEIEIGKHLLVLSVKKAVASSASCL